jgi:putative endonuclease
LAKHNEIGKIGETVAQKFLARKGFDVVGSNYRRKWGEIDLIAVKDNLIHFVEVKTVSRKSYDGKFEQEINNYKPEDNMHPWKLKRLGRAIQTYLLDRNNNHILKQHGKNMDWQTDLACVFLDMDSRVGKVRFIENIIL